MTNLKVVFHMVPVVSIYKFDTICNSTQSPAQPQSGRLSLPFWTQVPLFLQKNQATSFTGGTPSTLHEIFKVSPRETLVTFSAIIPSAPTKMQAKERSKDNKKIIFKN